MQFEFLSENLYFLFTEITHPVHVAICVKLNFVPYLYQEYNYEDMYMVQKLITVCKTGNCASTLNER